MIYNNRAGDGVTITPPAFNVSRETMAMPDIDDIWGDEEDMISHTMDVVFCVTPRDRDIELLMRNMDREMKTANNRPSNHHGSNPRRRK
jgi:hypothetical protein